MDYTKSFYSPREVAIMASVDPSTILNDIASRRRYAVELSERTYRMAVRAVIALREPERLAPSSMTEAPDSGVAREIAPAPPVDAVPA